MNTKKSNKSGTGKGFQKKKGGAGKHDDKYIDKFQDYFSKDDVQTDLIFNKAPVKIEKKKAISNAKKVEKKRKRQEDGFEDDYMGEPYKISHNESPFQDEETFMGTLQYSNFSDYFLMNKAWYTSLVKIPKLTVDEGCTFISCLAEKGPKGKYGFMNLIDNKRGFLSCDDVSDFRVVNLSNPKLGTTMIVKVKADTNKSIHVSSSPSLINSPLELEQLIEGMVFTGELISKEDHGYSVSLGQGEQFQVFFRYHDTQLQLNIPMLFVISSIDINLRIVGVELEIKAIPLQFGKVRENLEKAIRPGNCVFCEVENVLENGILVRFLKHFYGFIENSHYDGDSSILKKKAKFNARIIACDNENKLIFLSTKHLSLKNSFDSLIGNIYNGFSIETITNEGSFFITLKNGEGDPIRGYLHKSCIKDEKPNCQSKVKITSFNYFEGFALCTTLITDEKSWFDFKVGDYVNGKVEKNDERGIILNLGNKITALLENIHKNFPKKKKVVSLRCRIFETNPENKMIKVTQKLMDEDSTLDLENIRSDKPYNGLITKISDKGTSLVFLHGVRSFLRSSIDPSTNQPFVVGGVVKVYIKQSTSGKFNCNFSPFNSKKLAFQIEEDAKYFESTFVPEIGQVYKFKIDKNSKFNGIYLLLLNKKFKAAIAKEHLSDFKEFFEENYEMLLKSKSMVGTKFDGIVIGIDKGIPIISFKPSLIKQGKIESFETGKSYFGYISHKTKSGFEAQINSNLKAFIGGGYTNEIEYSPLDSILFSVSKIEDGHVTASALDKSQVPCQEFSFFKSYFAEQDKINNFHELKSAIHIGDYITGKIKFVKDYGLVVECKNGFTGLIMQSCSLRPHSEYNLNSNVIARIIDIDFSKKVMDLKEEEKSNGKVRYNLSKINHYSLKTPEIKLTDFKSLIEKDTYSIGYLKDFPKAICFLEKKKGPQQEKSGKKFKIVNLTEIGKDGILSQLSDVVLLVQDNENVTKNGKGSNLNIGMMVDGVVTKCHKNYYIVLLFGKLHARLHKSQVPSDAHLSDGDEISCKIIHLDKEKGFNIELTALHQHLDLPNLSLDTSLANIYNGIEHKPEIGKKIPGIVKSLKLNSLRAMYIELGFKAFGFCNVFEDIVKPENFKGTKEMFIEAKIGCVRDFWIKKSEETSTESITFFDLHLSCFPVPTNSHPTTPAIGDLIITKIIKKYQKSVRVQFLESSFGDVNLMEITDDFLGKPMDSLNIGDIHLGRIIKTNQRGIDISLRESILSSKKWEALQANGSAISYKKEFNSQDERGDLRNRILKFGFAGFKVGSLAFGYIDAINSNGCFVRLSSNFVGRVPPSEFSDFYLETPENYLYEGRIVLCTFSFFNSGRILSTQEPNRVSLSLRESIVKNGLSLPLEGIVEGLEIKGFISSFFNEKASVTIQGCHYRGLVGLKDLKFEGGDSMRASLPLGSQIEGKISKTKLKPKLKIRISVEKVIGTERSPISSKDEFVSELYDSIEKEAIESLQAQYEPITKITRTMEIEEESLKSESEAESIEVEAEVEAESEDEEIEELEEMEEEFPASDHESQESEVKHEILTEEQIRERESQLLDSRIPSSTEEFERLILHNSTNSMSWIQYAAFVMEAKGIEKSRNIFKRALSSIPAENELDVRNVYVAFFNLEKAFGDEASSLAVFNEALAATNQKKFYLKILESLDQETESDLIDLFTKKMLKKHKSSNKVWLTVLKMAFKNPNSNMKNLRERALQCLPKSKHVKALSGYARLCYLSPEHLEEGRTTFEAIVKNYPKRNDIWNLYFDCEEKAAHEDYLRSLLERCICLTLKPKKMKFFFKRFLTFESKFGNARRVEYVKKKAEEFVANAIDEEEEVEEDQN